MLVMFARIAVPVTIAAEHAHLGAAIGDWRLAIGGRDLAGLVIQYSHLWTWEAPYPVVAPPGGGWRGQAP